MTHKEIFEQMLIKAQDEFSKDNYEWGFCWLMEAVLEHHIAESYIQQFYPELWKHKPTSILSSLVWFPWNREGAAIRIAILKKLIK